MPSIRYFSVFFLCLRLVAAGQTDRSLDQLSSAERTFLDLILRDTISSTICRLPKGMNFGIQNPDTGRLVLVKEGRINQLLLEGTNRVYVPDTTRKKGLTRIDSTFYTGDNFNFMAFRRRDTLFQFGGFGFWDTRDFFTWYRAWNHEWEIKVQTDYLQHQWTAYQYDRESDALYVMGRRFRGPFDEADQYIDSVYQFDFQAGVAKLINIPLGKRRIFGIGACHLQDQQTDLFFVLTNYDDSLRSIEEFLAIEIPREKLLDVGEVTWERIVRYQIGIDTNH